MNEGTHCNGLIKVDNTVSGSGDVVLTCTMADEKTEGKWFKNGKAVSESDRVAPSADGANRVLTIKETSDADSATYEFRAEGAPKPATAFSIAANGVTAALGAAQVAFVYDADAAGIRSKVGGSFSLTGGADVKVDGGDVAADGERYKADGASLIVANAFAVDSGVYSFGDAKYNVSVLDVPSAPGAGCISDLTDETCRLDWTPSTGSNGGSPVLGYIVERKKSGNATWVRINNDLITKHNYLVRRLVDGATYQLRVCAVNKVGVSEPCPATDSFTPLAAPQNISALKVGATTDGTIELKWNLPEEVGAAGIDGYQIQFQICGGSLLAPDVFDLTDDGWKACMIVGSIVPPADQSVVLKGLSVGKNHVFRMRSKNSAGASNWMQVGPVCCAANVEAPKVLLPRVLQKQCKITLGEKIHLNIPFQGSPAPKVSWKKFVAQPLPPMPEPEPVAEVS